MAIRELSASSSSSNSFTSHQWTYDVFLSFRGEDTRFGFTGNLYRALRDRGIRTFFDDEEITRGQAITPALLEAIKGSRIAIVVFSQNYASSTFCLLELVHILEISGAQGLLVWPVFYDVDPSHVRHQRGSYAEALAKHEDRLKDEKEKVQKWRMTLHQAANLSGWHFKLGNEYEYGFIEKIVEEVSNKVKPIFLNITKYPVGLEARVQEVMLLIDFRSYDDTVNMVGIYGIGGIGKSTIARALYNLIADQFQCACFLADVREKSINHGLVKLQEALLFDLVREKEIKLKDVNQGISILKKRLHKKKVLVVLDDVDKIEQLRALAGDVDWFSPDSTVIITTRDQHLLNLHGVENIHEVEGLNYWESFRLLSWNAFDESNQVDPNYVEVMNFVVQYSQGLPLALEVIGSDLFGKSLNEWKSAVDLYTKVPNKEVQQILKVSYDCLQESEQEIFLDITCFFKGKELKYITNMIELAHGFDPSYGIRVLIDKSLIKIIDGLVTMHDLIQDTGREIVRQESTKKTGKRSRLWSNKDILHVLEENTGTDKTSVMIQDSSSQYMKVNWDGEAFKNMKNLKILIFENAWFSEGPKYLSNSLRVLKWSGYPSSSLPLDFHPKKLVVFELPHSCLYSLEPVQRMKNLGVLNLRHCRYVTQIPNISGVPNLKELWLEYCENLIEIHDSVGYLEQLEIFNATGCGQLRTFPGGIKCPSLKQLVLENCSSLGYFPKVLEKMQYLTSLNLVGTAIEKLPFSLYNLTGLEYILVRGLERIELPSSIALLPELKCIYAERCGKLLSSKKREGQEEVRFMLCSNLETVSFIHCNITDELLLMYLPWFTLVKTLDLRGSNFTILPASIKDCGFLLELFLNECKHLREVREIPPNIERLEASGCISLSSESRDFLLCQELHEARNRVFVVPRARIPGWFGHCRRGPTICFCFRNRFAAISVYAVLKPVHNIHKSGLTSAHAVVFINGKQVYSRYLQDMCASDHIVVNDLRWADLPHYADQVLREDDWNHLMVSNFIFNHYDHSTQAAEESGIYVNEQDCSMDDIWFPNRCQSLNENLIWDCCFICDQDPIFDRVITGHHVEVEGEPFETSKKGKEPKLNNKRKLEDDNLAWVQAKERNYSMSKEEKDGNRIQTQSSNPSDTIRNQGYYIDGNEWLSFHPYWEAPFNDRSTSLQEIFQQCSTSINLEQSPESPRIVRKTKGEEIIAFDDNVNEK